MRPRKTWLLCSPCFVLSIFLLILNDFVLKQAYPSWFNGKLSDFSGVFAFTLFCLVLRRARSTLWMVAAWFVFWKTPFSQPLIDSWNSTSLWSISRTVDYTDLTALAMIPLAAIYHDRSREKNVRRGWCLLSGAVAAFAFCATSRAMTPQEMAAYHAAVAEYKFTEQQPTYSLPLDRRELYHQIEALGFMVAGGTGIYPDFNKHTAYILPRPMPQWVKSQLGPAELYTAAFEVDNVAKGVVIRLTRIEIKRGSAPASRKAAIQLFEARVIRPLRAQSIAN